MMWAIMTINVVVAWERRVLVVREGVDDNRRVVDSSWARDEGHFFFLVVVNIFLEEKGDKKRGGEVETK